MTDHVFGRLQSAFDASVRPVHLASPLTGLRERLDSRRATVAVVGLGYVGLPLLVAAGAKGSG